MFGYNVAVWLATSIIIPCAVGIIYFEKLPMPYKLIVALLILGFFTELMLVIVPYIGIKNYFGSHIYGLLEIVLLSLFFINLLKNPKEKRMIWIIMIGLSVFALGYSISGNNILEFNSLPRALECIYFSLISCYLFYKMSIDLRTMDESIYFVNGSIFFYFSSSFLVFAFSNYKAHDSDDLLVMYNVHSIVNALCNLAYAPGLWIASKSSYSAA